MTTVIAVRKGSQIAMAADTLVTFGDTRLTSRFEDNTKLFQFATADGPACIGMAGTVAHFPVLRHALLALPVEEVKLSGKDEIFRTFTRLHPMLKENFFLQTKEEDHDPYESSQFSVLVGSAGGIFGVYSYREVFEFKEFWGIGSGRSFALGAMHAIYAKARTAREVADAGIAAACEFDRNSSLPAHTFTLKLKGQS